MAKRFANAVKGESELIGSDFVRAPSTEERELLKSFYANCSNRYPRRVLDQNKSDAIVILWKCPDVDADAPLAVSLVFEQNDIAQVRLHKTDPRAPAAVS